MSVVHMSKAVKVVETLEVCLASQAILAYYLHPYGIYVHMGTVCTV